VKIPAFLALILGTLAIACAKVLGVDDLTFAPGPAGMACAVDSDCASGPCSGGTCQATVADGGADAAGGANGGCSATTAWSPPKTVSDVGDAGSLGFLTVQLDGTGHGGVDLTVCKDGGFINQDDLWVNIVNNASEQYGLLLFNGSLPKGYPCTGTGALMGVDGFDAGEQLAGIVTIVSPGWAYPYWNAACEAGGGMGQCWTGMMTTTMTRTCF
jgi:hypothetical protein